MVEGGPGSVREVIPGSRNPRGQTKHTLKKLMMLAVTLTMVVIVVVVPTLAFDRDRFEGRFGGDLFAAGFYGGDFFADGAA